MLNVTTSIRSLHANGGYVFGKVFAPLRRYLPLQLSNLIRSTATAFLTPVMSGVRTGFFKSCFQMKAVSKEGTPLPWYTYPAIDFLKYRSYGGKRILEFGGGQSTLWWAKRAEYVLTCEGNPAWYNQIKNTMPGNVALHLVSMKDAAANVANVREVVASGASSQYDIVVIDGLYRYELIEVACEVLAPNGFIVCDNADAEVYRFYEGFKDRGMNRVDFYGNAPGVVRPQCTSLHFRGSSFVFDPGVPLHVIARE